MMPNNNAKNTKNSCDLTLTEYWEMYRFVIANERSWECKGEGCPSSQAGCSKLCKNIQRREHICGTLRTYTRYIRLLQESLGKKSICEISFGDVHHALEDAQGKTGWADETMRTVQSCLSIVFRYAEARGDACNITKYTSYREGQDKATNVRDLLALISSHKSKDVIQSHLQDIREKHIHRTKSLTIWQMEKLSQILQEGITKDGRYCALAIMLSSGISEQDQQLTLYVLRRNFWTWLESSTRLTDFEKRFIMGHEMDLNGRSLRAEYNDENRLWTILQKMDRCVLGKELHQQSLYAAPVKDQPIFITDRGLVRINITKEMLMNGGTLSINVTTTEPGDAITIKSLSPIRKLGGLTVRAEVVSYPKVSVSDAGINCEYENWLAHQAPSRTSFDNRKIQISDGSVIE